jgi:hypothetical protein
LDRQMGRFCWGNGLRQGLLGVVDFADQSLGGLMQTIQFGSITPRRIKMR